MPLTFNSKMDRVYSDGRMLAMGIDSRGRRSIDTQDLGGLTQFPEVKYVVALSGLKPLLSDGEHDGRGFEWKVLTVRNEQCVLATKRSHGKCADRAIRHHF
jgi:hypothetical protein